MSTEPAGEHRLLGVFAHPDDETIGAGTVLAAAVAAGIDVSVVTCTRGERGEVIAPELAHLAADGAALGAHREGELSTALEALGVHRHLFLDQVPGLDGHRPARFRDSGMAWVSPGIAGPVPDAGPDAFSLLDVEMAARLLAVVIRHVRPTALLTEEPTGGYGHPDHVQAHRVAMRAVEIAAEAGAGWTPPARDVPDPLAGLTPWQVPAVLWVAQAEPDIREAAEQLDRLVAEARAGAARPAETTPDGAGPVPFQGADGRPLEVAVLGAGTDLPGLVVPSDEIAAVVDTSSVSGRVLAALRAHVSQVQVVGAVAGRGRLAGHFALSNNMLAPLLDRAYVRVAPGYDAADVIAALTRQPAAHHPAPGRGTATAAAPVGGALGRTSADGPAGPSAGAPPGVAELTAGAPSGTTSTGTGTTAGGIVICVAVGVVMALLGTAMHRYQLGGWPLGMAMGLAGVLAAAVVARAVARSNGLLATSLAVVLTTQAMAFVRPGGDVIVTGQAIGYVWLFGAPAMCVVATVLPRRWFSSERVR